MTCQVELCTVCSTLHSSGVRVVYADYASSVGRFTTIFRTVFGDFNIHMFLRLIGMIMLCNDQLLSSNTH